MKMLVELTKDQLDIIQAAMIRYEEFVIEETPRLFDTQKILEVRKAKSALHNIWTKRKSVRLLD